MHLAVRRTRPGVRPGLVPSAASVGVVVLTAVAGCTGTADPIGGGGIDAMVIPTPSPRPADFVERIDNPWAPLTVGSTAVYRVRPGDRTLRTDVEPGPVVLGVATTAVRSRLARADGGLVAEDVDLYAQDRTGNVWAFGHASLDGRLVGHLDGRGGPDWRAGEDGVEAGLAVPAQLRRGDGFRSAYAPGLVDQRVEVVGLGARVRTPAGTFDHVAVLDLTTAIGAGAGDPAGGVVRDYLAPGVGLIDSQALVGTPYDAALVSSDPGSAPDAESTTPAATPAG